MNSTPSPTESCVCVPWEQRYVEAQKLLAVGECAYVTITPLPEIADYPPDKALIRVKYLEVDCASRGCRRCGKCSRKKRSYRKVVGLASVGNRGDGGS
jgi:hypothetical protein